LNRPAGQRRLLLAGKIGLAEAVSSELFAGLGSASGAEMMLVLRACGAVLSLPGILAALAAAHPAPACDEADAAETAPRSAATWTSPHPPCERFL
jgi:hypothetical protein